MELNKHKDLIISAKGKFRWRGDFEGLEELINQQLGLETKWSNPGGDAKKFENDKIAIRWYPDTTTLTIKGTDSSKLKDKLALIANDEPEATEPTFEQDTVTDKETKHGGNKGDEIVETTANEENHYKTQVQIDDSADIMKYLQQLENKMEAKFEELANDMRSLKATTELSGEIRNARKLNETLKLEDENCNLKEKVKNQSYLISELSVKVKDLENKRSSLLTVVRTLQTEGHNVREWKTVEPRRRATQTDKSHIGRATTVKHGNYHSTNKYEILSNTSDSEDIEIVDQQENYLQNKKILKPGKHHYKKPNNVSKTDKHEQYNESESEIKRNTSSQSPSVVIVGDSMIKHLDKRRLQRSITSKSHKVRTETYSGANIAAMKHHIKPCLESKPEKIILHVGTNDLCNKEATEIAEGIIEVGQLIKQESRKTEIIISQIVNRTDKAGMTKKITEVNELLEHYCKLNKWALIKHSNIESNHLNSYGLHLNRSGTAMLAKDITSFLNNKPN